MEIKELKKELNLSNKDISEFFELSLSSYQTSSAKERYEKALCYFYDFCKVGVEIPSSVAPKSIEVPIILTEDITSDIVVDEAKGSPFADEIESLLSKHEINSETLLNMVKDIIEGGMGATEFRRSYKSGYALYRTIKPKPDFIQWYIDNNDVDEPVKLF